MMSKIFLCAVALLWVASASATPACPAVDNPNRLAVLLADQENCGAYYECSNGTPYHMYCPGGLYYDIPLRTCNFKVNVRCGRRPQPADVVVYDA